MGAFRIFLLALLSVVPLGLAAWGVAQVFGGPVAPALHVLDKQLAEESRRPDSSESLDAAFRKIVTRATDVAAHPAPARAPASKPAGEVATGAAYPMSDALHEVTRMPAADGTRRALELLERQSGDESVHITSILGTIAQIGPSDAGLARTLLDTVTSPRRLSDLPGDLAWRNAYVSLAMDAYRRMAPDGADAWDEWDRRVQALDDPAWKTSFEHVPVPRPVKSPAAAAPVPESDPTYR